MLHYLKDYPSDFERDLNVPLMNKSSDRPLVEYVLDSWKSLQIVEGIKFLDCTYTENESEIDINRYIYKREKGKRRNEKCKTITEVIAQTFADVDAMKDQEEAVDAEIILLEDYSAETAVEIAEYYSL